jgi:hypothetical protein
MFCRRCPIAGSYTHSLFNMMVLSYTAVTGRGHFLTKYFLADGLAVVDQSPGPHVHLMSHPRIFSFCRMWRTVFGGHLWITLQPFVQGVWKQSEIWRKECWSVFLQNWTDVFMWSASLGVLCWDALKHRQSLWVKVQLAKGCICVYIYIYICIYVCVCVCVCLRVGGLSRNNFLSSCRTWWTSYTGICA